MCAPASASNVWKTTDSFRRRHPSFLRKSVSGLAMLMYFTFPGYTFKSSSTTHFRRTDRRRVSHPGQLPSMCGREGSEAASEARKLLMRLVQRNSWRTRKLHCGLRIESDSFRGKAVLLPSGRLSLQRWPSRFLSRVVAKARRIRKKLRKSAITAYANSNVD